MNAGSASFSISGFKVSFLENIIDLKGTSGYPALRMVAKMVLESDSEVSQCLTDMKAIRQLRNVSFKAIDEEIKDMKAHLANVKREIQDSDLYLVKSKNSESERFFLKKLENFHTEIVSKIDLLDRQYQKLQDEIAIAFSFFGESPGSKLSVEAIIAYVSKFLNAFEVTLALIKVAFVEEQKQSKKDKVNDINIDDSIQRAKKECFAITG